MRPRRLLSSILLACAGLSAYASADTFVPIEFSSGLSGWNLVYTPTFQTCGSLPGVCFKGNLGLGAIPNLPAGSYTFSFLAMTTNYPLPIDRLVYLWWRGALVSPTSTEEVGDYTRFLYSGLFTPGGNTPFLIGFSGGCGCLRWNITTNPPENIPEPATMILLASGVGVSLMARRRRRKVSRG